MNKLLVNSVILTVLAKVAKWDPGWHPVVVPLRCSWTVSQAVHSAADILLGYLLLIIDDRSQLSCHFLEKLSQTHSHQTLLSFPYQIRDSYICFFILMPQEMPYFTVCLLSIFTFKLQASQEKGPHVSFFCGIPKCQTECLVYCRLPINMNTSIYERLIKTGFFLWVLEQFRLSSFFPQHRTITIYIMMIVL